MNNEMKKGEERKYFIYAERGLHFVSQIQTVMQLPNMDAFLYSAYTFRQKYMQLTKQYFLK